MMKAIQTLAAALVMAGACAASAFATAPQPAKAVEISSYSGRWYEIARIPNRLQRGCVSGTVDYSLENNRVRAVQRCTTTQENRVRVYRSSGRILDPGTNSKTKLTFAGFWSQEYWVIDHARDWALVGDPSGRYLWLMSRSQRLPQPTVDVAVARIRALGYDAGRLEFAGAGR